MSAKKIPWYAAGLHFECIGCGGCCSGPEQGYIWVKRSEIEFIANFLKIPIGELRRKFLKRVGLRTSIIEKTGSKDCVFLQEIKGQKKCSIYPVRPNQCRTWPFWHENLATLDAWNEAAKKCRGINRGRYYTFEQLEKIQKQKKWWSVGTPEENDDKNSGTSQ